MVVSNSLWIVGTGDNIQFWSDNWLGEPLLDLLKVAPYLHENFAGIVADGTSHKSCWTFPRWQVALVQWCCPLVISLMYWSGHTPPTAS